MGVLGSQWYAYKQEKKKLDARCTKGIFSWLRQANPAYHVYFREIGKVIKDRVLKFPSKSVNEKHTRTESLLFDDDDSMLLWLNTNTDICSASGVNRSKEISGKTG